MNRYRAFMATSTIDYTTLEKLEQKAKAIKNVKYSIILHDRDNGSDHYHITLEFDNPRTINAIAKMLDIPPNFVEKWDKRTYNMYAYMLHHTTDAKNQKADYSDYLNRPDKFATNIENFEEIARPAPTGARQIDLMIEQILTGDLTRKQLLHPDLIQTYHKHLHKFDRAIKLRTESLKYNPPQCSTMLIYGDSGTGKTTTAYKLAFEQYPDSNATGSTPNDLLQDYTGEKCLIIDDFRPHDFPFIELLALLDPIHRQKTHRSRYYNKPLAAEFIIITSTMSLEQIVEHYAYQYPREDMKQLRRRIQTVHHLSNTDRPHQFIYDEQTDEHIPILSIEDNDANTGL